LDAAREAMERGAAAMEAAQKAAQPVKIVSVAISNPPSPASQIPAN